ncbi:MAG TPA: carboxypeptidase-like regulatory domain-containing protein [Candidatus Acidoferrales bacterium]|nr:carboxypeptidase-like regulatory domain-containing protein [Candidatus Acidoferrales bacterium]
MSRVFPVLLLLVARLSAQLTTGMIEGVVRDAQGRRLAGAEVTITGGTGLRMLIRADERGEFSAVLPYGR